MVTNSVINYSLRTSISICIINEWMKEDSRELKLCLGVGMNLNSSAWNWKDLEWNRTSLFMFLLRKLRPGPVKCLVWDHGVQWPCGHWNPVQAFPQFILVDIQPLMEDIPWGLSPAQFGVIHALLQAGHLSAPSPRRMWISPGNFSALLPSCSWNPWSLTKHSLCRLVLGMNAINIINISCGQRMTDTGNKYLFSLRVYTVVLVKRHILLLASGKIATEYLTYISLHTCYCWA